MRTIKIFDTTLRDGEQSPGASLNLEEKVQIARQLARMKVDVIEAGFPISSVGDFEAVRAVAEAVRGVAVCGLARTLPGDIDRAADALKKAQRPRIHVFCATSKIHRQYKLRKAKEEIVRLSIEAVKRARKHVADVEFSPEDASRTETDFLVEVVQAVIDAGATVVNVPDTVGYAMPDAFAETIRTLRTKVTGWKNCELSVHCHNDLGMGVANSLAAVRAGADQIECTINGLGERAGNAALEEIVMALKTRADFFDCRSRVDSRLLVPASQLVSTLTGIAVQRNKAIVGRNAFAHESGIHQDGVLKERTTYEIMRPEDVGLAKNEMVLGKHSGRHAFRQRVKDLGYDLPEERLEAAFSRFKELADKKKVVFDQDLEAIVESDLQEEGSPELWKIVSLHTSTGTNVIPTATIEMIGPDGGKVRDAATGDGPVDAVYQTINRLTGYNARLTDFSIRAVTVGRDAQGEGNVEIQCAAGRIRGRSVNTDVILASAQAYLNAINRALSLSRRESRKTAGKTK